METEHAKTPILRRNRCAHYWFSRYLYRVGFYLRWTHKFISSTINYYVTNSTSLRCGAGCSAIERWICEKGEFVRLSGRVAVVTGAARGIGAAEAIRLAQEGANVAVLDLSAEASRETVEGVEAAGAEGLAVACDVSSAQQVEAAFEEIADRFGRIDILVNNAGVLRDNLAFKMSEEDWDTVLDVHLKGSFLCSRAAQRYMVEQEYGKIVMTSSIVALGNRGQANYSSAKAGLQALARTLALELGRFNINVNAVAPGWIETEMTKEAAERVGMTMEEMKDRFAKNIPLKRFGRVEDIANVVAFLVSDEASYISGETIYVAGGPSSSVI
jgi:3-oxoacyl-[acyl-carrier protein] reductase